MKAKRFEINKKDKSYNKVSCITQEKDHSPSAFESNIIPDIQPPTDYVACIKISREPNGKILGTAVFIPAEFIEGLVDGSDNVNLKISLYNNNNIILSPNTA